MIHSNVFHTDFNYDIVDRSVIMTRTRLRISDRSRCMPIRRIREILYMVIILLRSGMLGIAVLIILVSILLHFSALMISKSHELTFDDLIKQSLIVNHSVRLKME